MTLDPKALEAAARALCAHRGYDPDSLEPGDVPDGDGSEMDKPDGRNRKGEFCHFYWRAFVKEAAAPIRAYLAAAPAVREGWVPQFDAMSPKQEALAIQFCMEIAGKRGEKGSPPDPVRLLEMAEALYKAEAEDRTIARTSP